MNAFSRRLDLILLSLGWRMVWRLLGTGFLVGLACWFFGLDAWRACLSGCSVIVAGLVWLFGTSEAESSDLGWRHRRRMLQRGSRSDIASLAASLHSGWGYVDPDAHERLQSLARRRLLLEGLDLDNGDQHAAIERRIGAENYRLLTGQQDRMPTLQAVISCLEVLGP